MFPLSRLFPLLALLALILPALLLACGPGPDREVLVALYNATDGPNWANNANWLSDAPLGEWRGVGTHAIGGSYVTGLNLHGNQLGGEIPPELGNLANLEWLRLYENQLSGEIPPELGNLANLRTLGLDGNRLSGCVPDSLQSQLDMTSQVTNLGGLPFC